jgi:hypothetical protein
MAEDVEKFFNKSKNWQMGLYQIKKFLSLKWNN